MQKVIGVQQYCRVREQQMKELKLGFDVLVAKMYEVVLGDEEGLGAVGDGYGQMMWYGQPDKHAF